MNAKGNGQPYTHPVVEVLMDSKGDIELNYLEGAEKLRYQIWYGDRLNFRYPFYTNIIC